MGGAFSSLKEQREEKFALGIRWDTNNQVEYWALWQGLSLMLSQGIRSSIVIVDSSIVT